MLSYLHAFHAGNFADVQKHAALTLVMTMMQAKSSAIACFDTHGGSAVYDLDSERARKTGEADTGIQKLWQARQWLEGGDWAPVLKLLSGLNPGPGALKTYPGSPAWFRHFLRKNDALTAFELHPAEGDQLERWARANGARVLQQDGLQGLLKQLPPAQPRLLALTDPSYEVKTEYADVAATLQKAWRKCRHGVYLVWYPVLPGEPHKQLLDPVAKGAARKVLRSEVMLKQAPERGMIGSGMLVINPPWGFMERFSAMMDAVAGADCLNWQHRIDWLVPE